MYTTVTKAAAAARAELGTERPFVITCSYSMDDWKRPYDWFAEGDPSYCEAGDIVARTRLEATGKLTVVCVDL